MGNVLWICPNCGAEYMLSFTSPVPLDSIIPSWPISCGACHWTGKLEEGQMVQSIGALLHG